VKSIDVAGTLHDHTDKLDKLREVDFGPKSTVTKGALVRLPE
jgi:hypothetical protein